MNNSQELFVNNCVKVLETLNPHYKFHHKQGDKLHLDKLQFDKLQLDNWDIIAGIILAGAITAVVVGISVASYYILIALCEAGILGFAAALITDKIKMDFVSFFKIELSWVLEHKLVNLGSEKLKELHHKIKEFLISHFDNNPQKLNEILFI